jgi:hypothetical protein
MHALIQVGFDGGFLESIAQVAVVAGTVVLLLMVIALGGFAYKSLRGDGIRWPDDGDDPELDDDDAVRRSTDEDSEWKYY